MALLFAERPSIIQFALPRQTLQLSGEPTKDLPLLNSKGFEMGVILKETYHTDTLKMAVDLYDGSDILGPCGILLGANFQQMPVRLIYFKSADCPSFQLVNPKNGRACFVVAPTTPYTLDCPLYAGHVRGTWGQWTPDMPPVENPIVMGKCTHVPSIAEPYLGVLTV